VLLLWGLTFVAIGDLYHPGTSAGYMEKCFDHFCQACPKSEVPVEDIMGTDSEDEAMIAVELVDCVFTNYKYWAQSVLHGCNDKVPPNCIVRGWTILTQVGSVSGIRW
jgi:hypothetical protein